MTMELGLVKPLKETESNTPDAESLCRETEAMLRGLLNALLDEQKAERNTERSQ